MQRSPQAIAVVYEGQQLTYAELNAQGESAGAVSAREGVGADELVGMCVERSVEMVVGILGILKAGGAYVPLDPSYPRERLEYMLQDAAPKVVLIQEGMRERLPATSARLISLDGEWDEIAELARERSERPGVGSDATTPGVCDLHLRLDRAAQRRDGGASERGELFAAAESTDSFRCADLWTSAQSSFAFDFSVWELGAAVAAGARGGGIPRA